MSFGESTGRPRGPVLRVLIVDDASDDAELMAACLEAGGSRVHLERVETEEAMADALRRGGWDVVLCDYSMPSLSSERALALLARVQPSLPAIIVSGAIGEEAAAAVIRAGAIDFVSKDHLVLLPAAVRRALDEAASAAELARATGELRDAEQRFRVAVESLPDPYFILSPIRDGAGEIVDFRYEYASAAGEVLAGSRHGPGRALSEFDPGIVDSARFQAYRQVMATGEPCRIEAVVPAAAAPGGPLEPRVLELSVAVLGDSLAMSARDITELRGVQAQLQASEERFRVAVESMLDAFTIFSPVRDERGEIVDFRYEYVNDAACAMLGFDRDQLLGHRCGERYPAFPGSGRFALFRQVAVTGEPAVSDDLTLDGAWAGTTPTDRVFNTVIVAMGENLVFLSRDVTDRWKAERELELRAELLDLAHDAVIVREPSDSRVSFWNREAQAVYGYSAAEAIGRVIQELLATVFPDSREAVDEALARDGQWSGELRHVRKDGSEILVSSRQALQRDADGRALAIIELNSDITAQRQAEAELRASRARLTEAERIAAIGSWEQDLSDDSVAFSDGMLAIYGLSADQFDGTSEAAHGLVAPEDQALVRHALGRAIAERSSYSVEYRAIRADGRVRHLRGYGDVVVNDNGQPIRVVGVVQDITDAKRTQEALQSTSTELARRANELQQLALRTAQEPSDIPHAPLTARQLEIMRLVAEGLTNAAIGERLFLASGTVKWHIRQIMTKTNSRNRAEAIARILGTPQ
jgi:PAS domain S-box-containing protein